MTGVEVIGGPYLHTTVTTNFTQFGENKLFGEGGLGPRLVRPLCPTLPAGGDLLLDPKARAFCFANPDLVRVVEDDGTILIGR